MIISNSKVAMSSESSFKAKNKTQTYVSKGGNTTKTLDEQGFESSFSEFKDGDDAKGFSGSFNTYSKSRFSQILVGSKAMATGESEEVAEDISPSKTKNEGAADNMIRLKNKGVRSITESRDRMNVKRVREQTIMYLLLRIRRILEGKNASTEGASDYYNLANGQGLSFSAYSDDGGLVKETYISNTYEESENTSFDTVGTVLTEDGREINFNVSLTMSRAFERTVEKYTISKEKDVMSLVDPLIINLDGNVAGVSDQKFFFDIDADGTLDEISMLQKGSGYLALDKNDDGIINDGSELFGTSSGNGFKDLAAYDEDGNGWIDEADEIFDKLKIWVKDESGNDKLYKLKELGVGAINLESVNTPFSYKTGDNAKTNAILRHTGMFLYEDGRAGTMQHLDMAT